METADPVFVGSGVALWVLAVAVIARHALVASRRSAVVRRLAFPGRPEGQAVRDVAINVDLLRRERSNRLVQLSVPGWLIIGLADAGIDTAPSTVWAAWLSGACLLSSFGALVVGWVWQRLPPWWRRSGRL